MLCVAAVTTVLLQAIKQPVVVGYLIAGVIVGPHTPILFADHERIHTISELGVILLMFSLGLEFSVRRLLRLGPTWGFITALQVGLMVWLGYMCGQALGWTTLESIFTGAILSISSTTIVVKVFEENKVPERLRELVHGVLLTEDLVAVVELALLTALAEGNGMSARVIGVTVGRLALFLALLIGVGFIVVPRVIRMAARFERAETLLVASIGICFGFAIIAEHFGYSVALGSFLAGSLVAESGEGHKVEHLIVPVRDMFAAVFFVSVGMMLDPSLVAHHWIALLVLVTAVTIGKIAGVTVGAMLAGCGPKLSVEAGMSLAQIGEFSFIIAALALETHAAREFLYSLAIAVSVITTFTTPYLIKASGPLADAFERHLPRGLSVIEAIYISSIEHIRSHGASRDETATIRWSFAVTIAAAIVIVAIVIGAEVCLVALAQWMQSLAKVSFEHAEIAVGIGAVIACIIPSVAVFGATRRLARALARRAIPDRSLNEDTRPPGWVALVEILQAAMLILVTIVVLAIVQPVLQPLEGVIVLALALLVMCVATWRGVSKSLGQVRDAARLIANSLAAGDAPSAAALEKQVIPGIGAIVPVRLAFGSSAIGKTVGELDLQAAIGAVVVAIGRHQDGLVVPSDAEVLREGDVLGMAGSHAAIQAAVEMLTPPLSTEGSEIVVST